MSFDIDNMRATSNAKDTAFTSFDSSPLGRDLHAKVTGAYAQGIAQEQHVDVASQLNAKSGAALTH